MNVLFSSLCIAAASTYAAAVRLGRQPYSQQLHSTVQTYDKPHAAQCAFCSMIES
jgi:hypothetical protein